MVCPESVMERLWSQSLFSKKEFQPPAKILERVNYLTRLRYVNQDSFIRETTKMFSPFAKTKNSEDINPNDLIATIFALKNPLPYPGQTKYQISEDIQRLQINLLIDSLLGNNTDFIKGKKSSTFIQPAYLLLRATREKSSWWSQRLIDKWSKKSDVLDIREIIKEIVDKILSSINLGDVESSVKELFERTIDFEPPPQIIFEEPEQPRLKAEKLDMEPKKAVFYNRKFDQFTDEKLIEKDEKHIDPNPGFMESTLDLLLTRKLIDDQSLDKLVAEGQNPDRLFEQPNVLINRNGEIIINQYKFGSIKKGLQPDRLDDPEDNSFSQLTTIFGKDNDQALASAALISYMAAEKPSKRLVIPSVGWLSLTKGNEGPDCKHLRRVVRSFEQGLIDVFADQTITESLKTSLEKTIQTGTENYSGMNQILTDILYRYYYQTDKSPTKTALNEFSKLKGVVPSIFALRKLFMIRLLRDQLALDKFKKHQSLLNPDNDIISVIRDHKDVYEDLAQFNIDPSQLLDMDLNSIIMQGTFFSVLKYIRDNRTYFKDGALSGHYDKDDSLSFTVRLPQEFQVEKTDKTLSWQGVKIPIDTMFDDQGKILEVLFKDTRLTSIPIHLK